MKRLLVVGYGNELRGDDAAGPTAARAVAVWQHPGVRALDVHQLTPELAEEIALAAAVVFIDADASGAAEVRMSRVVPVRNGVPGHTLDPAGLLEVTAWLYDQAPRAWLIAIPGERFDLGEGLSRRTRAGVDEAVGLVKRLIQV